MPLPVPNQEENNTATPPTWASQTKQAIISELRKQRSVAAPLIPMNSTWFARTAITTAFLGRLGELPLAAGTLGFTFANVTGFSVLSGLCWAMEPICGQAHGGPQQNSPQQDPGYISFVTNAGIEKGDGGEAEVLKEPWWRIRKASEWARLLKLAWTMLRTCCLEWWCYEILTLTAGWLPSARQSVSVLAIVLNFDYLLYGVMVSLATCVFHPRVQRTGRRDVTGRPRGRLRVSRLGYLIGPLRRVGDGGLSRKLGPLVYP
uniref:Uncharacterized protein n=1 Tax=Ananas comosus var. bracteatus TaxID=296719 RepID=A0A6V7QMB0_ANACO|nr:unnamed protein product [Ananas comosus var. bracteatus]